MSAYLLARALPPARSKFQDLVNELSSAGDCFNELRFTLAALNDLLSELSVAEFVDAVSEIEPGKLTPFSGNYLAAMVEMAAARKRVPPPVWTREVAPLESPWFAVPFSSLRPHLMKSAPVAFKRRNLFVDAAIGDRV